MSAPCSAGDVAAYLLERTGLISAMKLHKLVYYAQAWHLVWAEEPLFAERIEAWPAGPVTPALYELHRGQFTLDAWPAGSSATLGADERSTVDAVIAGYGSLEGRELTALTHSERPWREARGGLPPTERGSAEIDLDCMQEFYVGLENDDTAVPVEELNWSAWRAT